MTYSRGECQMLVSVRKLITNTERRREVRDSQRDGHRITDSAFSKVHGVAFQNCTNEQYAFKVFTSADFRHHIN